ncbi:glycosyl hydrolase family 57 [Cyanobacterium sp. IPPAS B-1200]|uniref:glycosyl hydrolase family 57 n=1 Tax=Cyanobacterium sp. IPPAS B-1200 TaxID=1562720 RepID=UPI0008524B09|nr:glycosyl hydrolase family 57 [Cyanobacterium sp. IPPAS B-1200]OEJ79103.1 glycosyl hydrolase family 57 [Cyanobacterium sp. IPPAS B-1200]
MTATNVQQFRQITADIPPLSGKEAEIEKIVNHQETVFLDKTDINLQDKKALFACALHMHQPTIPAGQHGELISNLQHMFEHQGEGDNHNASVFAWCYSRMGDFIPELVANGCSPRIMLDYSGNLLWGLQQMGREDVLNNLRKITQDETYQPYIEWLGTMWSHGVIPSTPIPDIKLHIQAWQHHFAAIFGEDALKRVKGFSPPEMHLPNHPDTLYEYIKALKECGYRWLLVQEHSVERLDGQGLHQEDKYIPNRLVAKNSQGETITITALIKTQGSDTKLVAQMQPYHEAKSKSRQFINGISIPPCVTQIADGENGGVMMNEFPRDFPPLWYGIKDSDVVGVNGTEYLELLAASGVSEDDFPVCQAVGQHKIWQRVENDFTSEKVESAIAFLTENDHQFHTEGASWTNDLSWVRGYENVLQPMNQLSALFHQKYDGVVKENPEITKNQDYQEALLYHLLLQTSCFRYWGQGTWTDYAKELYQRGIDIIRP